MESVALDTGAAHDARHRFLLALTLVLVVAIAGSVLLIRESDVQAGLAADINEAGRQRMLVQRVAVAAATGDDELLADSLTWLGEVDTHLRTDATVPVDRIASPATLNEIAGFLTLAGAAASGDRAALTALPERAQRLLPLVDQVATDYERVSTHRMSHVRALGAGTIVVVFILSLGVWIGVVRPSVRRIEASDTQTRTALAVVHDRAAESLRHAERIRALTELTVQAVVADDLDPTLRAATMLVHEWTGADSTHLVEADATGEFVVRVGVGDELGIDDLFAARDGDAANHVLRAREPLLIDDLANEPRLELSSRLDDRRLRSGLMARVPGHDAPIGLICALSRSTAHFSRDDQEFIALVGVVIGSLLDTARARRRAEADRLQYSRLTHNSPDMIFRFQVRPQHRLLYVSPAIESTIGHPADAWYDDADLLERMLIDERRQGLPGGITDFWDVDGESLDLLTVQHSDGDVRHLDCRRVIVESPEATVVEGVCRDVTAFHTALRRLEAVLERERDVIRELQRVATMRDDFMTAVSHDLRTPLTVVVGLAETLNRSLDLDEATRDELTGRLATNANRLADLVADLLELQRTDSTEVLIDAVAVHEVVAERIDALRDEDVTIVSDLDHVTAVTDSTAIARVVEHLVGNAIKHCPRDSTIWVGLVDDDDAYTITVEDDGPGIPRSDRERVFLPFERGGAVSVHSPGQGIGLTLVRRMVQHLGGDVTVDDSDHGGAAFIATLPTWGGPEGTLVPA